MGSTFSRLLESNCHASALGLILKARQECNHLRKSQDPEASTAGDAGIAFLDYFELQWMPVEIWTSWSRLGREKVACRIGIPLGKVLTTTNHLESLNGTLKGKYLGNLTRSGYRLRPDVLIFHLSQRILPQIYARRRLDSQFFQWRAQRFLNASGGNTIVPQREGSHSITSTLGVRAWFIPDERRDIAAQTLFSNGHVVPIPSGRKYELWARCKSEVSPDVHYWLTMHPTGSATCTCRDWMYRGGACKHLRAFRKVIEQWCENGILDYRFLFPLSFLEAEEAEARGMCWYGPQYPQAVTCHPNAGDILKGLIVNANSTPSDADHTARPPHMTITAITADIPCLPPPDIAESEIQSLTQEAILHSEYLDVEEAEEGHEDSSHFRSLPVPADNITPILSSQELDFHSQASKNSSALSAQLQQQVHHDISVALPLLHGILSKLGNPGNHIHLTSSETISDFREVLGLLDDSLAAEIGKASLGCE